jgi:hypothetical protein
MCTCARTRSRVWGRGQRRGRRDQQRGFSLAWGHDKVSDSNGGGYETSWVRDGDGNYASAGADAFGNSTTGGGDYGGGGVMGSGGDTGYGGDMGGYGGDAGDAGMTSGGGGGDYGGDAAGGYGGGDYGDYAGGDYDGYGGGGGGAAAGDYTDYAGAEGGFDSAGGYDDSYGGDYYYGGGYGGSMGAQDYSDGGDNALYGDDYARGSEHERYGMSEDGYGAGVQSSERSAHRDSSHIDGSDYSTADADGGMSRRTRDTSTSSADASVQHTDRYGLDGRVSDTLRTGSQDQRRSSLDEYASFGSQGSARVSERSASGSHKDAREQQHSAVNADGSFANSASKSAHQNSFDRASNQQQFVGPNGEVSSRSSRSSRFAKSSSRSSTSNWGT